MDLDYVSATALSGSIKRDSTHPSMSAALTLPNPGAPHSLGYNKNILINQNAAVVKAVNSTRPDGTYSVGEEINVTVTFDREVFVTGTPTIILDIQGEPTYAPVASSLRSCSLIGMGSRAYPAEYAWHLVPENIPSTDGSAYQWSEVTQGAHSFAPPFASCLAVDDHTLSIRSNGIPDHAVGFFPMDDPQGTLGKAMMDNPNQIRQFNYQWRIPRSPLPSKEQPTPLRWS